MQLWLTLPAAAAPLGRWPLDEGSGQVTADASGNGHEGRLGVLSGIDSHDPDWVTGRFGNALRFEGESNDFVTVRDPAGLRPSRITVEAWVRRLGGPGSWRYVVSSGASACDSAPYGLYSGFSGGLAFYVSDQQRYVVSPEAAPSAVWDGNWHYAAGTYDGQRVRLYVDGVQVAGGTAGALGINYGASASGVFIGTYRGSCELPFTGDIDEVTVHDRALTPGQIAGEAGKGAQQPLPVQLPPVTGPPSSPPRADSARGCPRVGVNPRRLVARRRTSLLVSVRKSGRAAVGSAADGPRQWPLAQGANGPQREGASAGAAEPAGRVRVKPGGQPRRCTGKVVRVAKRS